LVSEIAEHLISQHKEDSLTPINKEVRKSILDAINSNQQHYNNIIEPVMSQVSTHLGHLGYDIKPDANYCDTEVWEIDYL